MADKKSPLGRQPSKVNARELQDGGVWSPRTPPRHWLATTPTRDFSDHDNHSGKKNIYIKVKEKAKKWKQLIAKKKHGNQENNPMVTSNDAKQEEHDYYNVPVHKSEKAPEIDNKEPVLQCDPTAQFCDLSKKFTLCRKPNIATIESGMKHANDKLEQEPMNNYIGSVTENKKFNYNSMHGIQGSDQNIGTNNSMPGKINIGTNNSMPGKITEIIEPVQETMPGNDRTTTKLIRNKSVSLKESLMNKLEPREEDRALCQIICEALRPRRSRFGGNVNAGVIKRLREVISSLISGEEPQGPPVPVYTYPYLGKFSSRYARHNL